MKNKITLAFVVILVSFASLYLGTTAAVGDIVTLSGWFGISLLIFFLIKGYQFAWQVMLFISWSSISFMLSFRLAPIHAISVIFVLFVLSCISGGLKLPQNVSLRRAGLAPLNVMIVIFLVYGAAHLAFSRVMPAVPGEFSLGNSAKAYFTVFAPLAFLLFGLNARTGFQTKDGWVSNFLYLMAFAVVGNVAYLGYLYVNGFSGMSDDSGADEMAMVYIPLINAVPHHFAMRTLGPLAILFGFGLASTPGWWRAQRLLLKLAVIVLIVGGLGGSVMSGGRAAVVMCFFFLGLFVLHRRQIFLIMCAILGFVAFVVVANLFSTVINEKAPMFVARPLQYLMVEKGIAMDTINSSQDQRGALHDAAIKEWKSDPRITLIGRGVYAYRYTASELKPFMGEQEAFVKVNLRAGTCHALIPSALIQYGILGLIIYLIILLLTVRFTWGLYQFSKRERLSEQLKTVILCLLFYVVLRFFIDMVSAGWMSMFVVVMLMLIRSRISYELAQRFSEEESPVEGAQLGR
ncbi:hypothetical protein N9Z15_05335 [Akkermansiaceae bacterium]|nr:hypothetical protein [Akkermansiaceae bacterium]MDB4387607.1 hypothetical protein [Akkermansiaceae bacterium]